MSRSLALSLSLGSLTKRLKKYGKVSVDRYTSSFYPRLAPCLSLSPPSPTFLKVTPGTVTEWERERDSYWKWLESRAISCARAVTVDTLTLVPLSSYAQWSPEKYKSRIIRISVPRSLFTIITGLWVLDRRSSNTVGNWSVSGWQTDGKIIKKNT